MVFYPSQPSVFPSSSADSEGRKTNQEMSKKREIKNISLSISQDMMQMINSTEMNVDICRCIHKFH
jgi:hypothetical protein